MTCPNCGRDQEPEWLRCPFCGAGSHITLSRGQFNFLRFIVAVCVICGGVLGNCFASLWFRELPFDFWPGLIVGVLVVVTLEWFVFRRVNPR